MLAVISTLSSVIFAGTGQGVARYCLLSAGGVLLVLEPLC